MKRKYLQIRIKKFWDLNKNLLKFNKFLFAERTFVFLGLTLLIILIFGDSKGSSIYAQSQENKSFTTRTKNLDQKTEIVKKILTNYVLLAKGGDFSKFGEYIAEITEEINISKKSPDDLNNIEKPLPENLKIKELDFYFINERIPKTIYNRQQFIDDLKVNFITDSKAVVCVRFGFETEESRFMVRNFHLFRQKNGKWKIFNIETKIPSITACEDS